MENERRSSSLNSSGVQRLRTTDRMISGKKYARHPVGPVRDKESTESDERNARLLSWIDFIYSFHYKSRAARFASAASVSVGCEAGAVGNAPDPSTSKFRIW